MTDIEREHLYQESIKKRMNYTEELDIACTHCVYSEIYDDDILEIEHLRCTYSNLGKFDVCDIGRCDKFERKKS
tara:strand:- start:467 stop:688 length:222 start_codon:yes stop_codon:yes gene_type:complete